MLRRCCCHSTLPPALACSALAFKLGDPHLVRLPVTRSDVGFVVEALLHRHRPLAPAPRRGLRLAVLPAHYMVLGLASG